MQPQQITQPPVATKVLPTQLIPAKTSIPHGAYSGEIVEVRLGATKSEGGTRGKSYVIGGQKAPAYYNFEIPPKNKPIIAMDVFDWPKISLSKAVKMHFREVVDDVAEWARLCVDKFGAEIINCTPAHNRSTDRECVTQGRCKDG